MSFLSRKPGRPGSRGSDDAYDDDDYAADNYQGQDDTWSPGEYFSPDGIKGRWAGEQPDGRAGGRGRRDSAGSRDPFETGDDPFETGRDPFDSPDHGGRGKSEPRGGYGADDYASGAYDLPEGADDDRQERGRRRRRDREDSGERTGIFRLRRDRGEDIWPDDGISDEDYWASVAADRPLNGAGSPPEADRGPAGGPAPRRAAEPRPGEPRGGDMRGGDQRGGNHRGGDMRGGDQRGGDQRGAAGRLGPPPGLAGDYRPGSGPMRAVGQPGGGQPGGSRATSGPQPARPGTGPVPVRPATGPVSGPNPARPATGPMPARSGTGSTPARPGTGPTPTRSGTGSTPTRSGTGPTPTRSGTGSAPVRPVTGPTPTVGVTASRPPAGQNVRRPGPGTGPWPGQARQQRPGSGSGGFPQSPPRPSFQPNGNQPGGSAGGRQQERGGWGDRTERIDRVNASGYPDPQPGGRGPGGPGAGSPSGAPGRGRAESGDWRTPDRREADRRDAGRDAGNWTAPGRGGGSAWSGEDDPLTSQAYSRSADAETDGRSYRVAARRSQAQAMLTEQAETFITGHYQSAQSAHTGDYPTAAYQPVEQRTGEYRQYQGKAPATDGRGYPAYGSQPAQPARAAGGSSGSGNGSSYGNSYGNGYGNGNSYGSSNGNSYGSSNGNGSGNAYGAGGWPAQPGGVPGGQYDAQPQQRPQAQPRQPAPLPAAPLSAPVPSSGASGAKGGLNPYDVAITGSYPYPGQTYPAALPPAGGPAQADADDPYYRPLPADGAGYGASYGNGYQDPRDRRY